MAFLIVATGRNCAAQAPAALESIRMLEEPGEVRVAVVDDASTDGTCEIVEDYCNREGWAGIFPAERYYALRNQYEAWSELGPKDDDVVIFLDLDDAFDTPHVTQVLRRYYDAGAWMTYGSYRPWPADHPDAATCRPAAPYPDLWVQTGGYRHTRQHFNHLRTISWRVLKHLTIEDLTDDNGRFWRANTDRSVMFPCLELAAERAVFVPEILYRYTCNNDLSVWRTMEGLLVEENNQLRKRTPKRRLP